MTLAIILVALLKWEYMWEGEFLGKWASIVTMISLGLAPATYFWKKWQDAMDERIRASKNLHTELANTLNGLNEKQSSDFRHVKLPSDKKIEFMNKIFNHDFYDSLVFSGKINFLPPNLQQFTQNVFQKIEEHNYCIRKIREIESDAEDEDVFKKTVRYYKLLDKIEGKLLSDIPTVMKKHEKVFSQTRLDLFSA